jgi:hypothetical protein
MAAFFSEAQNGSFRSIPAAFDHKNARILIQILSCSLESKMGPPAAFSQRLLPRRASCQTLVNGVQEIMPLPG